MPHQADHRMVSSRLDRERGFSLVEMMTALAITLIVVAGVLASFTAQSRVQLVQDTIAEGQGNLRAGMELLKRDIRNAGFETPDINSLTVGNNTGLNATDQITVTSSIALPEFVIRYAVQDVGGVSTLIRNANAGSDLAVIPNVEDLQLAYGWDANANNVIDAGEWVNNPAAGDIANISAIRINLLVRARRFDSTRQNYRRPAIEDHAAAVATDAFPRRLLTTIVQIRNKGL